VVRVVLALLVVVVVLMVLIVVRVLLVPAAVVQLVVFVHVVVQVVVRVFVRAVVVRILVRVVVFVVVVVVVVVRLLLLLLVLVLVVLMVVDGPRATRMANDPAGGLRPRHSRDAQLACRLRRRLLLGDGARGLPTGVDVRPHVLRRIDRLDHDFVERRLRRHVVNVLHRRAALLPSLLLLSIRRRAGAGTTR